MIEKLKYDPGFIPVYESWASFEKKGHGPFFLTLSRGEKISYTYPAKITKDPKESYPYVRLLMVVLLWMVGGEKFTFSGDRAMYDYLLKAIKQDEELSLSLKEMGRMFGKEFELSYGAKPPFTKEERIVLGGGFKGNRIGIDLGGSDRKVTATIDGKTVFSEEVLWLPKEQTDWHYLYDGILDSYRKGKEHLPSVDAVGISTAGVVINNRFAQAALAVMIPDEDKYTKIRDLFLILKENEFPNTPMIVANDGDISALGASMVFHKDYVLGLAMGTSEATGYCVNNAFNGWINELGKVPFNADPKAYAHYAMKIPGAGSEYLSQKGIIRLARAAGYSYEGTLAMQLKEIQKEAEKDNPVILECYREMGVYLASAILLYSRFLEIHSVLLLGRVLTGKGGDVLTSSANEVLKAEGSKTEIFTADENFKRLGQSYIAASLPKID